MYTEKLFSKFRINDYDIKRSISHHLPYTQRRLDNILPALVAAVSTRLRANTHETIPSGQLYPPTQRVTLDVNHATYAWFYYNATFAVERVLNLLIQNFVMTKLHEYEKERIIKILESGNY